MSKYFAIYKCPMCNTNFRISEVPVEIEENMIGEILNRVIRNQEMLGSMLYQAPLYVPHECENGDGGLAQLIGFMKVR